MKLLNILFCSISLITLSLAEENSTIFSKLYLGTEMNMDFLTNSSSNNYNLFGNSVKIGYRFSETSAVELTSGSSIFDEDKNRLDSSLTLNGKIFYDGYNIDFFNLTKEETRFYYLFGISSTDISNVNNNKTSNKLSPTVGIGLEHQISDTLSIYAGYNFLSLDVSQVNVGVNYYFSKNKTVDYQEEELKKIEEEKREEEEKKKLERERVVFEDMTEEEKVRFEKMLEDEREQNATLDNRLNKRRAEIDVDDNKTHLDLKLLHKENIKKPILVYLYELSSIDEFKRLDYEETIVLKKGELSGAVLGQVKLLLKPLKMESFNLVLKDETQYFAVVAAVEDEKDIDEWRWIKKVKPHKLTDIRLMFNHKKITEFK